MSQAVVVTFGPGSLGLGLVKGPEHSPLKAMVQDLDGPAAAAGSLAPGMMLTHIDDHAVRNVPYQEIIKQIVNRARTAINPLKLTFLDCGMDWELDQIKEQQRKQANAASNGPAITVPPGALTYVKAAVAVCYSRGLEPPSSFSDQWLESLLRRGVVRRGSEYAQQYAVEKVHGVSKMHAKYNVPELMAQHPIDIGTSHNFAREISCGSMYWYGYDRDNRPILWVRPSLKHLKDMDVRKEVQAHILLLEHGLAEVLPSSLGVTQVTLVVETAGIDPVQHFAPCT
jgi:hypothetical protein